MKKIIYFLLFITLLAACTRPSKVVKEKYSDGSPKVEKYYKGEGADTEMVKEVHYYPNKQKEMEGGFNKNERDGYWVYYYKNGNKWSEGTYKNGVEEGIRTVYYESGGKRYEGNFTNGRKTGDWKFYDEKGKVLKVIDCDKADTTAIH